MRFQARVLLIGGMCVLGASAGAHADPFTLTVNGTGGRSSAVSGFSDQAFWWADYTGGVAGSAITAFGFNPVPGRPTFMDHLSGSFLLSSPFTLGVADTLTVALSVLTANNNNGDVGFALLLENSTVRAVLANVRPDGQNTSSNLPHPASWNFAPTSPGVTSLVTTVGTDLPDFTLGGALYGVHTDPGSCGSGSLPGCATHVASSFAPGAGTYQMLFGIYSFGGYEPDRPSAIAVRSVTTVPEPSTMALISIGVAGFAATRRRRRSSCQHD